MAVLGKRVWTGERWGRGRQVSSGWAVRSLIVLPGNTNRWWGP